MAAGGKLTGMALVGSAAWMSACLQVTGEATNRDETISSTGRGGGAAAGGVTNGASNVGGSSSGSGNGGAASTSAGGTTGASPGTVTTVAGNGQTGLSDGSGGPNGRAAFEDPTGLAFDHAGNLFVADSTSCRIRRIDSSGNVTTVAGTTFCGFADGAGDQAAFNRPSGIAFDAAGDLYIADKWNFRVRKMSSSYEVTTVAGTSVGALQDGTGGPNGSAQFWGPENLAVDTQGNVYVADGDPGGALRMIDPGGNVITVDVQFAPQQQWPHGLAFQADGHLYVTDADNNRVFNLAPTAKLLTFVAGNGVQGEVDGPGGIAEFAVPAALALDGNGNLFVLDAAKGAIRVIDRDHNVSTLTISAALKQPWGMTLGPDGDLYVADTGNNRIVKIGL